MLALALAAACTEPVPVTPLPIDRLSFLTAPVGAAAGVPLAPAIQVAVLREDGTLAADAQTVVTLQLATGADRDTLQGAVSAPVVQGVASFAGVSLRRVAAEVSLVATAPGIAGAVSSTFSVGPGPAARLEFTTFPSTASANTALTPAPTVRVLDASGNVVGNAAGAVALGIAAGPAGATLTGTTAVSLSGGTASFGNVRLSAAGSYVLQAAIVGNAAVLPAVSGSLTVGAPIQASRVQEDRP